MPGNDLFRLLQTPVRLVQLLLAGRCMASFEQTCAKRIKPGSRLAMTRRKLQRLLVIAPGFFCRLVVGRITGKTQPCSVGG